MPNFRLTEMSEKNQSASGSPWVLNVITTCISKLGYSRTDVLDLPLRQILTEYARYLESEGVIEINTDARDEFEEKAKQFLSKVTDTK